MSDEASKSLRVLIANRGEIARRVMRSAHRLGHSTVAIYADPDANAPFVREATMATRIGPAALSESYLSVPAILGAAKDTGATAIHPGYGFLSENPDFARAVIEAGLIWVGPNPDAIDQMGSKIDARRLATSAGVPVIPGYSDSQDADDLHAAAVEIGYPILVKAAAGGGGKGIRIANGDAEFAAALNDARTEASRSFGDDAVIVERYIQRPRHIEVQIVGDKKGTVLSLGTRECSVQRRYQKLLEEAPAPNLIDETRRQLETSAVQLGSSISYDSTGTVEFIVDDASGEYFFLEMNTRLQVEHPVTEAITGLDLVELQLRVATGEALTLTQDEVRFEGHAFEVRVNAEDPASGFAPQIGRITHLKVPPGVRWDSGVEEGSEITPHYDPMVAKLIVHADNRTKARMSLVSALDQLLIGGLVTNTGFHRWLVEQPPLVEGRITTRFLDETELPDTSDRRDAANLGARAWVTATGEVHASNPWKVIGAFRVTPHSGRRTVSLQDLAGEVHDVLLDSRPEPLKLNCGLVDLANRVVVLNHRGQSHTFNVLSRSQRWAPSEGAGHGHAGAIVAPFPAVVTEVSVSVGDVVGAGDPIVVIEAMKMLHTLTAAGPGTVEELRVGVGEQVASNQVLATFADNSGNN